MKKLILITGGILIFVLVAGAGITYWSIARSFQKDLDASLDKVRKSGHPMTAAELQPAEVDADKNAAVTLAKAFGTAPTPAKSTPTAVAATKPGTGGKKPSATVAAADPKAEPGSEKPTATPPAATDTGATVAAVPAKPDGATPAKPGAAASATASAAIPPVPETTTLDLAKLLNKDPNFALWTPADKKDTAALLQTPAFKAFFAAIETASRQPSCNFGVDYTRYTDKAPPHLERVRDAIRALTIKAQIEAWSGNPGKAADTTLVGLKTTKFLQGEPSLISQLFRFACERILCNGLESLAFTYDLPPEKTMLIMQELEHLADTAPLVRAMDGERVFFGQQEFERLIDGRESMSDLLQASAIDKNTLLSWKMVQPVGNAAVKKDYAVYLDMLGKIQENLKTPYYQTIEQRKKNPIEKQIPAYCVVSRMTLPAIDSVLERAAGAQACLNKCRSNLGLNLFRQRQGAYPVMLNELVPDFLAALPLDPFTGNSFDYRRAQKGYFLNCLRGTDVGGAEVELTKDKLFSSLTAERPGAKVTVLAKE